ncbi:MAG: hypothetical protein EBS01_01370 [Verrucomicrobia bacterium]|nr:hypothetical protein [Verrucomicrobiota bacterium]
MQIYQRFHGFGPFNRKIWEKGKTISHETPQAGEPHLGKSAPQFQGEPTTARLSGRTRREFKSGICLLSPPQAG